MDETTETAVRVTLKPLNDPSDLRCLALYPGSSVPIGRASKSSHKQQLQAWPSNALFDCPVISRLHAVLRLGREQDQVTLVDKHSTHGTKVNGQKLVPEVPFTLRDGDTLQLGDQVIRGQSTHNSFAVLFERSPPSGESGSTNSFLETGFNVPGSDDSEPEEFGPDDFESEAASDMSSILELSSSPKTSMEEEHAPLGSQEKPIDVDSNDVSLRQVINLAGADDEDEVIPSSHLMRRSPLVKPCVPHSEMPSDQQVIEDSVDRATGTFHLASQPVASPDPHSIVATQSSGKNSLEKVLNAVTEEEQRPLHSNGVPSLATFVGDATENDILRDVSHFENLPGNGVDDLSDSDVSDIGFRPLSEESDDEPPELLSAKKQSSPELGTQTSQMYVPPTKPRYDPVRSSPSPGSFTPRPIPEYRYNYPRPYHGYWTTPNANSGCRSRWDVPPPLQAFHRASNLGFVDYACTAQAPTIPAFASRHIYGAAVPPALPAASLQTSHPNESLPPNAIRRNPTIVWTGSGEGASSAKPESQQARSNNRTKLAINNLVDDSSSSPGSAAPVPWNSPAESPCTGSKRKVGDMTREDEDLERELTEFYMHRLGNHKGEGSAASSMAQQAAEPATKKYKRDRSTIVSKASLLEASKVAGSALTGMLGLYCFLISPWCEKLLNAMS